MLAGALSALLLPAIARAEAPAEQPIDPQQVEAWLESRALPASVDSEPTPEAPPPPPHHYGFSLEASAGVLSHIGGMQKVSPAAPFFRAQLGWEPLRWLMLFVAGDIAFGSTRYANPPPEPRGYALWGLSGGLRLTVEPTHFLGIFVQGEIGAAEVAQDVLWTYGFTDADSLGPFYGGLLGFEWYQVNPHYAIVVAGGVRNYGQILDRELINEPALAWIVSLGLNYTF